MRRRDFLKGMTAASCGLSLPGLSGCAPDAKSLPPGSLDSGNARLGHRLRHDEFPPPAEVIRAPVLIAGAGIAGLSAAWRLKREGFDDFALVELEDTPGGNSRYGENAISRYPLAAHYLPLPNPEARAVRALLADLGVLQGDPAAAEPVYDERYLCHAPQERLYRLGVWQEGLIPHLGVARAELDEQARFFARMESLRALRDKRGRRVFALPLAYGGEAPEWVAGLDTLTMFDWMRQEGFNAPSLHWYVNYVCRDDYGTDYRHISAWAGVHYFACRTGRGGEGANDSVLTAPEGNGWLVEQLLAFIGKARAPRCGEMVHALAQTPRGCRVDVWNEARQVSLRYEAEHLVWAAPLFVLAHVARELPSELAAAIAPLSYAPWLIANLSLSETPPPGAGLPLCWDNVLQDSPGLGYVTATHQNIRVAGGPTVLTYYNALSGIEPFQARHMLLSKPHRLWAEEILRDLARAHRDIRELTTRLDIQCHGHAMSRPLPGFNDPARRRRLADGWGRVRLAHADLSGLSLFEESNYWGVRAAENILTAQGARLKERLA
ncbi:amino oxidase [Betaproteobacteria bacterium]|nr:amino oxidase [Betaproteobacteria bacterium]